MNQDIITQDQRLVILRALQQMPAYSANESILQTCLAEYGHHCPRDLIHNLMQWLAEQHLLAIEHAGSILIATLTARGQDVAQGLSTCIGVKKPRANA